MKRLLPLVILLSLPLSVSASTVLPGSYACLSEEGIKITFRLVEGDDLSEYERTKVKIDCTILEYDVDAIELGPRQFKTVVMPSYDSGNKIYYVPLDAIIE